MNKILYKFCRSVFIPHIGFATVVFFVSVLVLFFPSTKGFADNLCPTTMATLVPRDIVRNWLESAGPGHLVGFAQNSAGLLRPIVSSSNEFDSSRQFEPHVPIGPRGWNPKRIVRTVPLIRKQTGATANFSPEGSGFLPHNLSRLFSSGAILVTDPHAVSVDKDWTVETLRMSRIFLSPRMTRYSLLMAVDPGEEYDDPYSYGRKMRLPPGGRTGVLLDVGLPVVLGFPFQRHDGSTEWFLNAEVLEVKGAGGITGGFRYGDGRRWHLIDGGVSGSFGQREFADLSAQGFRVNEPNAVVHSVFDSPVGPQSQILRFSPGTVRATHSGNPALSIPADITDRTVRAMAKHWARQLAKGVIPASHAENLVVLRDYDDFALTDRADLIPIGQFPLSLRDGDTSPQRVLLGAIATSTHIPGYVAERNFPQFRDSLISELATLVSLTEEQVHRLRTATNDKALAGSLWDLVIAKHYYLQRRAGGQPICLDNRLLPQHKLVVKDFAGTEMLDRAQQVIKGLDDNIAYYDRNTRIPLTDPAEEQKRIELRNAIPRFEAEKARILGSGLTVDGLMKTITSSQYRGYWEDPERELEEPKWSPLRAFDKIFGEWTERLLTLRRELHRQRDFFRDLTVRNSDPLLAEDLLASLRLAEQRYLRVSRMTPYDFVTLDDADYSKLVEQNARHQNAP